MVGHWDLSRFFKSAFPSAFISSWEPNYFWPNHFSKFRKRISDWLVNPEKMAGEVAIRARIYWISPTPLCIYAFLHCLSGIVQSPWSNTVVFFLKFSISQSKKLIYAIHCYFFSKVFEVDLTACITKNGCHDVFNWQTHLYLLLILIHLKNHTFSATADLLCFVANANFAHG